MISPDGVICPIACAPASVNHRLPSGPGAIPCGPLPGFRPAEYSVIIPDGVIRPIALVSPATTTLASVNHMLPSAPGAIANGKMI